jgi:hypothetical protein
MDTPPTVNISHLIQSAQLLQLPTGKVSLDMRLSLDYCSDRFVAGETLAETRKDSDISAASIVDLLTIHRSC